MADRRRISDVVGLEQVHANYRDAVRPICREPLRFEIIWPDLIVDALKIVWPEEFATALIAAGVDRDCAKDVALILAANGLFDNGTEEGAQA